LADGVSKRANLPIHIDATVSGRLPTATETTIYRIVQEALTNAVKHANATNVWIRAWREDFTQCCTIRDDGAGFKVRRGQGTPRKGLGLVAMRERVSAIGGTLQIESRPGHGLKFPSDFHWRVTMPTRIILADDHVLVRQGLRSLLEREKFK